MKSLNVDVAVSSGGGGLGGLGHVHDEVTNCRIVVTDKRVNQI